MNYLTTRTTCLAGFAMLFATLLLAGCASPTDSPITVKADLNRAAVPAADKKFVLAFDNPAVEQLLLPFRNQLEATLVQLGYRPVLPMDATVVVCAFFEMDRLVVEKRTVSTAQSHASMNTDSPRHKNIAGMVSGGRYSNLLNDRPTNPGEVFIGPENEIITTGDMRRDPEPMSGSEQDVTRKINRLVLFAVETPIPSNRSEAKVRWRVEVVGNVAPDEPAPELDRLVEIAIQNVAKHSHGPLPEGA